MQSMECVYGRNRERPRLIGWLREGRNGQLRYVRNPPITQQERERMRLAQNDPNFWRNPLNGMARYNNLSNFPPMYPHPWHC